MTDDDDDDDDDGGGGGGGGGDEDKEVVGKLAQAGSKETTVCRSSCELFTRVGTLILATIYLQLIQNRYMFRSFTVLHCSHQHCVQPVASDVEVVGYF